MLAAVGTWHIQRGFTENRAAYAARHAPTVMSEQPWRDNGWRRLPQRRIDLGGETEETFALQWAGSADSLREHLATTGWTSSAEWSLVSVADFARNGTMATLLPVLPLLHDGRPPC